MQERITAHEFGEWWALYRMEPWGEVRSDLASGLVASTLANIYRKEGSRPYTALDFAPYLKERDESDKAVAPAQFVKAMRKNG